MARLLIVADDFTGALDTGVQFAARGAVTRVVTDPAYDFSSAEADIQVLVMVLETRHAAPEAAYSAVLPVVERALASGFTHIYKKTDSALRGNVGAELAAVLDGAKAERIPFLPSFPKLSRVTKGGVLYIDGQPVAESVFGHDLFEPVRHSAVAEVLREQTEKHVSLHPVMEADVFSGGSGIQVYDAVTDEDLRRIGLQLGAEGVRLSAGCAGFAAALADILELDGETPLFPKLEPSLFIVCGSVNPVTLRQMDAAEAAGFTRVHLTPQQKLEADWAESAECAQAAERWLRDVAQNRRFILDVNDPAGRNDTAQYAAAHGLTTEELRVRICKNLAALMKRLLDGGLNATLLCTGGDTLLALMRQVGVQTLAPICEAATGAVLTDFRCGGKTHYIISKSGGFGEPELFCGLAALVGAAGKN